MYEPDLQEVTILDCWIRELAAAQFVVDIAQPFFTVPTVFGSVTFKVHEGQAGGYYATEHGDQFEQWARRMRERMAERRNEQRA